MNLAFVLIFFNLNAQQASSVFGHVLDKDTKQPVMGANVNLDGSIQKNVTDALGAFEMEVPRNEGLLIFTMVGYDTVLVEIEHLKAVNHTIYMSRTQHHIDEVVVSTGYETYSQQKGTGAVEFLDQKLLNRNTGMDILGRLENMTSGLYFDKGITESSFSIIGRQSTHNVFLQGVSTLRGSSLKANQPLIILDNFPYEGDLNMINPNDVESISILKDASAAAIWGAKAGNGVIVITTKKTSNRDEKTWIEVYSNMQIHDKPDLFARSVMSNKELIDLEIDLYKKGFYNSFYNASTKPSLPPVVELLYQHNNSDIETEELERGIQLYSQQDIRNDMLKYMYRKTVSQQYGLRIEGGGERNKVGLSVGYDKTLATRVSDDNDRLNIKLDNIIRIYDRLQLESGFRWNISTQSRSEGVEYYTDSGYKYSYVNLADEEGNPLPIPWDYRMGYLESVSDGRLLDWHFRPLDEVRRQPHSEHKNELQLDLRIKYDLNNFIRFSLDYRYGLNNFRTNINRKMESYTMRNLINRGTEFQDDNIIHHYPVGGMKSIRDNISKTHWGRMQLNINREFGDRHHIRGIAGLDISSISREVSGLSMYGYDDERDVFASSLDYYKRFPVFDNLATNSTIGSPLSEYNNFLNRSVSIYANANYTFDRRHILSSSFRRDAANVFGLETNNRWTPLWSVGYAYLLHESPSYNIKWLPQLKVRSTYGVSGNVDNSMSSLVTVAYANIPISWEMTLPRVATVNRLPDPTLRWEKVKQFNLGVDITMGAASRVRATVDYYHKRTDDLLYNVPIDPSLGRSLAVRNVANTETKGVNVNLNTVNIERPLQWTTNLNFAYNNSWIINTFQEYTTPTLYVSGSTISEMPGTMVFGLYSYEWGGLDPETGQPRGVVNGEKSMDYRSIIGSNTSFEDLYFHGSSRPLYFGALRNDFNYKSFNISFNISYEFDYYFKRNGLDYATLLSRGDGHRDYEDRWQKPGDELTTHVPSFIYPINSIASTFYKNSAVLVERGDHIRLRDIRLDYNDRINLKNKSVGINVYAMVNNLGVLWKSTSLSIDPQFRGNIPPPRFYSLGLKLNY